MTITNLNVFDRDFMTDQHKARHERKEINHTSIFFTDKNLTSVAYMCSVNLSKQIVDLSFALMLLQGMFLTALHI